MTEQDILNKIRDSYHNILGHELTGIYVHGSIAFGCFNWENSDIDFLVVAHEPLSLEQKQAMINVLLDMEDICPKKGVEMSVVQEKDCKPFVYPTPYELHYSVSHRGRCRRDLQEYCRNMNGVDKDLAAHTMVTKQVGFALCGKPIDEVFGEVSSAAYLDSIKYDVENAAADIKENPVYIILNLCRVLAYQRENVVISKRDGGVWGIKNLPLKYHELIRSAMEAYAADTVYQGNQQLEEEFAADMCERIFSGKC